jgi:2-polyprenyl-3-methyl-5-hydroxy-6-metoxy-1,4-benzoquinol methylase
MKVLDKLIRYWRVEVALCNCPKNMKNVFDIGCDDSYLLKKLKSNTSRQDGVDPRLDADVADNSSEIKRGFFPSAIQDYQMEGIYDAIFALAVFEHFSEEDLQKSATVISKMLSPKGKLIITIPEPVVDKILDILIFFRLIDGQATEEHHGFDPDTLVTCFSKSLRLVKQDKFQFGLNNLFVFERY